MDFAVRQILAPVDLGDSSRPALRAARLLAERFGAGITALYVDESLTLQTYDSTFGGASGAPHRGGHAGRQVAQHAVPGLAPVDPQSSVAGESPARAIIRAASSASADLIVMGTHSRRGVRRMLDGSVAETVLRTAHCPVLVVPEVSASAAFGRILCTVDGSPASRNAARFASVMAKQFGAQLVLARIGNAEIPWIPEVPEQWLDVAVERTAQRIFGCARDAQADLLVVGCQRSASSRLQITGGLTVEELIRHSPCAVLDVVTAFQAAAAILPKHVLATA